MSATKLLSLRMVIYLFILSASNYFLTSNFALFYTLKKKGGNRQRKDETIKNVFIYNNLV